MTKNAHFHITIGERTHLNQEIFHDIAAGERMEADLIAKVRFKHQDAFFLIHIEPQATHQEEFPWRMFRYFARLHEQHRLPVYPIALYSFDRPRRSVPTGYSVSFFDYTVLDFRFRAIQLNRLDWRNYVNRENPIASALMAKINIAEKDRLKVRPECLRLMVSLKLNPARMKLIAKFVDSYLRLSEAEKQEFQHRFNTEVPPPKREEIMQLSTSWEEAGIKLACSKAVKKAKFYCSSAPAGSVPLNADIAARINAAAPEQIEAWAQTVGRANLKRCF